MRHLLLTGGIDEKPWPWLSVDIQVHSGPDIQFSDADGKPLNPGQGSGHSAVT
jgi:hypothetical protein